MWDYDECIGHLDIQNAGLHYCYDNDHSSYSELHRKNCSLCRWSSNYMTRDEWGLFSYWCNFCIPYIIDLWLSRYTQTSTKKMLNDAIVFPY